MMRRGLQFLLALALILAVPSLGWCAQDIFMIDAHSQIPAHVSEEEALSWMDKAGIGRAILSPVGGHDVHKLLEFARAHPDRVTPSIPLKNKAFRNGDPAALERVRRMGRHRLFGAMSEVMVAHERKADVAPEIVLGLDAASVQTALSIALKRDWPLVIHIEFGFAASLGKYDFYMAALEDLLRRYPEHPFVLSHMGQLHADAAKRLIDSHANIYFLTSHANPIFIGDQKHILPWTNLFSGSELTSEWKALFVAHPDRFILAFDNVYDPDWGNRYVNQAQLWRSALADLPASVANAVAHGNAERLWHLTGRRPVGPCLASARLAELSG